MASQPSGTRPACPTGLWSGPRRRRLALLGFSSACVCCRAVAPARPACRLVGRAGLIYPGGGYGLKPSTPVYMGRARHANGADVSLLSLIEDAARPPTLLSCHGEENNVLLSRSFFLETPRAHSRAPCDGRPMYTCRLRCQSQRNGRTPCTGLFSPGPARCLTGQL